MIKEGLVFLIKGYRKYLSPWLPMSCRFYPSCSVYALKTIEKYGPLKGAYLSLRRLLRCHPLSPGGYDPIP